MPRKEGEGDNFQKHIDRYEQVVLTTVVQGLPTKSKVSEGNRHTVNKGRLLID